MEHLEQLVKQRKSVRSFDGAPLRSEDRAALEAYLTQLEAPFDVPMEFRVLDGKEHGLTSPVVTGTTLYAAGKTKRVPHAELAFGYAFEHFVLYAMSLGVGTVWIAGTMDRPAFEKAMAVGEDELLPAVTPLGYPAAKRALRDAAMRRAIRADSRQSFESLFFDGDFSRPLTAERAGDYAFALELVRLAPSAVNKQPWRVVVQGDAVHFYKAPSLPANPKGDVQMLDLGIALAHFTLGMEDRGVRGSVAFSDPGLSGAEAQEYAVTWHRAQA